MSLTESNEVEITLQQPDVHHQWEDSFRTADNARFYDQAFDYLQRVLNAPKDSTVLDVGCGIGAHSIRLAERGFSVLGVDFSESVLKMAAQNISSSGLQDSIRVQHENILSLSFADGTFDYILCWGVLMHIPDVERAISELERVLRKGGILVISEGNMLSLQSIIVRSVKMLLGMEKATIKKTASGLEYWTLTPAGRLMTRQADIGWLKKRFKRKGFAIKKHVSGQFTEAYTRFSSRLARWLIHCLNHLWFKYVKIPWAAYGNILIVKKQV